MKKLLLVASVLVLTGCGGGGGSTTPSEPSVNWSSYPSSLKQIIDTAEADRDCQELQSIFDTWINANATDVANYVDDSLRSAGCYN